MGGPKGHKGHTLRQVDEPDHVIIHAPPGHCDHCHSRLDTAVATTLETRQVFELPSLSHEVTEHRVLQTRCTCGKIHRGQFPAAVAASVQYGPRVLAGVVHLNQHHMVPLKRSASLMGELFGLPMSEATILSANAQAATLLAPTVNAIKQAFVTQPTVHADETGLRVAKSLHWLHTLASEELTWVARHAKRGAEAFEHFAVLPLFKGVLIHDGWKPYRALDCLHGLCNAHHLRELTYVAEELKQDWAQDMIELLTHANSRDRAKREGAQQPDYAGAQHRLELRDLRDLYEGPSSRKARA